MRTPKIGEIVLYRVSGRWLPAIVTEVKAPRLISAVVFGLKGTEPSGMVYDVVRGNDHNNWKFIDDEEFK